MLIWYTNYRTKKHKEKRNGSFSTLTTKQDKSALDYCLKLLRRDKSVLRALQEAKHLFGAITNDINTKSKHWIFKTNTTSKE